MEDLCERPRKLIHKELRSQYLDAVIRTLAGTCIKQGPPNSLRSQQILMKLIKN
jgi:hypothetical protein